MNGPKDQKLIGEDKYKISTAPFVRIIKIEKFIASIHIAV